MNILVKLGGQANQHITTAKVGGFQRIIKIVMTTDAIKSAKFTRVKKITIS
jgi:hypothetical protein